MCKKVKLFKLFVLVAFKIAQEITEEGRHAIESPTSPVLSNLGPEGYMLGEFQRTFVSSSVSLYLNV